MVEMSGGMAARVREMEADDGGGFRGGGGCGGGFGSGGSVWIRKVKMFREQYPHNIVQQMRGARGRAYAIDGGIWYSVVSSRMDQLHLFERGLKILLSTRIWLEKEPPRSIQTWDDLVSKFITQFFPPSKTTNLRNEITRFQQRIDESFYEAWERFNGILRACPHHGFSKLHQLDTFYNALNVNDQDSLNSAAGGKFLDKMPRECLKIIESKSKVCQSRAKAVVGTSSSTPVISSDVAELNDMVKSLLLDKKNQSSTLTPSTTPAPVKAVESKCVTCGAAANYNQGNTSFRPQMVANQIRPPGFPPHQNNQNNFNRGNNFNQNRGGNFNQSSFNQGQLNRPQYQNLQNQMATLTEMMSKLVSANTASSSGSGTLPGNTVTNSKEDLKVAPVSAPMPNLKPFIPYPSRRDNEKRHDQANEEIEKFYEIFKDMSFEISFTDALILMPKFASTLKALIGNKKKLSEMARTTMNEHCSAVILNKLSRKLGDLDKFLIPCEFSEIDKCLALADLDTIASGNPTPIDDPIVSTTSPTLTPFGDSDFLLFEEADAFLGLEDDPDAPKINPFYYDPKGDILLLEAILNSEPLPPLPNHEQYLPSYKKELKVCEAKTVKSSVDEPPKVKLKDLPPHLEYAFLEGDNKLPVIIAKELGDEEKSALIKVLKSHKRAIAWKLSDIQGINPEFCTHKILMEEDYKPAVQHQRRVNPKIYDVIKKEVEKLLDAGLLYPISDSTWVSLVHCVPKKGGFTVVENEENELIPTRFVTGWQVCIDYRKLNEATRKDHFPLPFMDQMLERLAGNEYYCFLDGFSGYFQIPIDPRDQEKTTFTCPYGTFAYRRMPFGLCNAPGTFQREL
uniref:Reverse transcriptase domain-containing protein n=1 Tax=Tanacetum cinerariifolium TaxID=118510 RepID=A0A6L2P6Z9_TANCI|nr:reverse transcriptase domain-containing protein [Tanacetum cinerariifolium]